MSIRTDGSAVADAAEPTEIDRSNDAERWRYRCPRGHVNWSPTNNHVWCQGCRRQAEAGEDVDPEWWELVDAKTDERLHWASVELSENEGKNE